MTYDSAKLACKQLGYIDGRSVEDGELDRLETAKIAMSEVI